MSIRRNPLAVFEYILLFLILAAYSSASADFGEPWNDKENKCSKASRCKYGKCCPHDGEPVSPYFDCYESRRRIDKRVFHPGYRPFTYTKEDK